MAANWIPAFLMAISWSILDIVPFSDCFAPFADSLIWQLAAIFILAAGAKKTFLLKRLALIFMKFFGPGFKSQVFAMLVTGLVATPFIPAIGAKAVLGSSTAMEVAEAMGLKNHSKGRTGLFIASFIGFCAVFPAVLSSSILTYMARGFMPAENAAELSWGTWFLYSIVWLILFLVIMFAGIIILYHPKEINVLPRTFVEDKLAELGAIKRDEVIVIVVLCVSVVLWVFESYIGLTTSQVALIGGLVLFLTGVLSSRDLGVSINWSFIIFVGCILSLGIRFTEMGISVWVARYCTAFFVSAMNPYLIITTLFVMTVIVNLFVTSQAVVMSMFSAGLIKVLMPFGINPFLICFILMMACSSFLVPYENPTFIAALESTNGTVSFRDVIPASWLYTGSALAACLLSVPYWSLLGVIG